jgi:hypothetical protein
MNISGVPGGGHTGDITSSGLGTKYQFEDFSSYGFALNTGTDYTVFAALSDGADHPFADFFKSEGGVLTVQVYGTEPVPAPAGIALLGLGSMGLAFIRRRKAVKA